MGLLIGADPEFALVHKIRPGEEHLERGINADRIINDQGSRFGCDGYSATAEIRPEPASSPQELIKHCYECFYEGLEKTNAGMYAWKAGSYVTGKNLGGHIHFNHRPMGESFYYALDNILSIPLALLEDPEERQRRIHNFGQFHSWRDQTWGIEYRTPASWLVSKGIAFGVISIAFAIYYEFRKGSPTKTKIGNLGPVSQDTLGYRKKIPSIFKLIKGLSYFKKNKEALAGAFFIKQRINSKESWQNGQDIKERWGIKVYNGRRKVDPNIVWEKAMGGEWI